MSPDAFTPYVSDAERDVRAFAAEFPTAQTLRAVALCESGRLSWLSVAELFARSLGSALSEVRAEP
jgi:hypothetical protein